MKGRLEKIEDLLLERREKQELKRALRESAATIAARTEYVGGESSQQPKRRRLVKLF